MLTGADDPLWQLFRLLKGPAALLPGVPRIVDLDLRGVHKHLRQLADHLRALDVQGAALDAFNSGEQQLAQVSNVLVAHVSTSC